MLFERCEGGPAEGAGHLLAKLLLLAGQHVDRPFEIFRHHHLHAVAIEADQLPQERGREQILSGLVFLLENDLREHRAGDVVAGLCIEDELEQAFSGKKSAQAAMDSAVARGNTLLRQFERTNP
jgi:hypothetical protein